MIIDIHVHAYADKIVERAMARLKEEANVESFTNGTIYDLREKLTQWGIDYGVMLPVATKPTQQTIINDWAKEVEGENIISFGSVHPFAKDVFDEIDRIKSLGLKGIKIHPDYQDVFLFDRKLELFYSHVEKSGLPLIIHMGYDPVSKIVRHAMPSYLADIAKSFPKLKFIAAHFGGMMAWEEVARYLVGIENVWLDTAFTAGFISPQLMTDIIKKHGANKILFGSDCPWHSPTMELELLNSLSLSDTEKELILSKNAIDLLELF